MRWLVLVAFLLGGCGDDDVTRADGGPSDGGTALHDAGLPPRWRLSGSTPSGFDYREAVLLRSGDVFLIRGGARTDGNGLLAFNPSSGAWRGLGDVRTDLANHAVVVLDDGRVLATSGGSAGLPWTVNHLRFSSSILFDPSTGSATPAPGPAAPRMFVRGLALRDGRVLLVGGATETPLGSGSIVALASAESYDPITNAWSPAGTMADARWSHGATLLDSGEVLVTGGTDEMGRFLAGAEIFDPTTGAWRPTTPMRAGRAWHAAVHLGSGRVLVAGGQTAASAATADAELYDPATETWSDAAALPSPAMDMGAAALSSGNALVAGGWQPATMTALAMAWIYDETAAGWRDGGTLNHARSAHSLVIVPGGRAVTLAGYIGRAASTMTTEITDGPVL